MKFKFGGIQRKVNGIKEAFYFGEPLIRQEAWELLLTRLPYGGWQVFERFFYATIKELESIDTEILSTYVKPDLSTEAGKRVQAREGFPDKVKDRLIYNQMFYLTKELYKYEIAQMFVRARNKDGKDV